MKRILLVLAAVAGLAAAVVAAILLWRTTVPTDLDLPAVPQSDFDAGVVREAEEHERVARLLSLGNIVVMLVVLVLYARHGGKLLKESAAGPIGTGFMLGILGFCLVWLAQLPLGLASFLWDQRYDVVDTNVGEWLLEQGSLVFSQAFSTTLILLVVMGFARLLPSGWWLPAGGLAVAISLGLAFVSPYLIASTLDRPTRAVREDAERLADTTDLDDVDVRIEQVSAWTSAPNAFAVGLGESRLVVLWDTLADGFPRDEVRVVLAHELGHHEHRHILKSVLWSIVFLFPAGIAVALVTRRRGGMRDPAAVPTALLVYVVLQLAFTPLDSQWSQRLETEADWAALQATQDPDAMEALFQGFADEGMSDPDPPGWWSSVFDSHPTGAQRVALARAWKARYGE